MNRKSKVVGLGLLATVAGGVLSGCGGATPSLPQAVPASLPANSQVQQCVDAQGRVIPDSDCEQEEKRRLTSGAGYVGGPGPFWIYHGGMPYRYGDTVPDAGLRRTPLAGLNTIRGAGVSALRAGAGVPSPIGTGTSVQRGGFGSSAVGRSIIS